MPSPISPNKSSLYQTRQNDQPPTVLNDGLVVTMLDIQNFKGVSAVKWAPDGDLAVVSGNNGAGKSSVLDAVMSCLTSGAKLPEMPIKRGHKKATCFITLGRRVVDGSSSEAVYRIERSWTPSGGSIKIENADGAPITERSGDWLARMFGNGGCDPLAFAQAAPAEQRATLLRVTGLNTALGELDARRAAALVARRDATNAVAIHNASLSGLPDRPGPDVECSASDLLKAAGNAAARNAENLRAREWLAGSRASLVAIAKELGELEAKITNLRDRGAAIQKDIDAAAPEIAAMKDEDVAAIQRSITTIEADNAIARHRKARRDAKSRLDEAEAALVAADRVVDDIDAKRRMAIEEAKMPVKGLAFADDSVTFDRIPLAQVNTATQIRVGVALALAEKKPIRVIFTRYGSLLDHAGMVALRDLAAEHGAQVFVERVSSGEEGGIVITDGVSVEGGAA